MAEDPRRKLRAELGAEAVAALEPLADSEFADFAAALEGARKQQQRELREAAESSLGFVPGFLRGAAKRIVFR